MSDEYEDDTQHTERIKPLRWPGGQMHHTDAQKTQADREIGNKLAFYMGDLFIDSHTDAPVEQWQRVARALRIHGLKIVNIHE